MAQGKNTGKNGKSQQPRSQPPGKSNPAAGKPAAGKGTPGKGSTPQAKGRESVAAVRKSTGSNRTQLIIGGVAILAIVAVIVVGVVMNRQSTAKPVDGYGQSTQSVATFVDGVTRVDNGTEPALTIDVFQDPLCPWCQVFEHQFGEQINQAVDRGQLRVNYHTLTFLNSQSASGDYSSRAATALSCVAGDTATGPGVWMSFMQTLYADDVMPAERGSVDLTNEDLARIAGEQGATEASRQCILDGTNTELSAQAAQGSAATLTDAIGRVSSPVVLKDGVQLGINEVNWLTDLLPADVS